MIAKQNTNKEVNLFDRGLEEDSFSTVIIENTIILIWILLICLTVSGYGQTPSVNPSLKYSKIKKYMDNAVHQGLSGVTVYISHPKSGEWIASSGYANLETREKLEQNHIFSMGSIGKTYNAFAVLKLVEEHKLALDDKILIYLPSEIIENLPNASEVTIRHLLSHQSGLVNYDRDPELNRLYISGLIRLDTLSRLDVLRRYVYNKPAQFKPGEEYRYSSTNYLLLAMIVDVVTPAGHTEYLNDLLQKYGYLRSYYRQSPPQRNISYYGDLNHDEILEDLTAQTFETTNWFTGDDGVYATIEEAAQFLQDLAHGRILSEQMLKEMTTWNDERRPDYGLGLIADKSFPYKFLFGHSGRGIGMTTDLYYFPKQNMTVAIFCNTGIRASSLRYRKVYNQMRSRIIKKLFLF